MQSESNNIYFFFYRILQKLLKSTEVIFVYLHRYHMNCLTPSLSSAPEGDWICSDCVAHPPHTGKAVEFTQFCFRKFESKTKISEMFLFQIVCDLITRDVKRHQPHYWVEVFFICLTFVLFLWRSPFKDDSMLEADISDGEVTDLLSDFDGPALITNRLRVSTTNRPSSSTGRRRSTRLRSGTSADSSPRTPTTWVSEHFSEQIF